jgi:transposase InsO family protein
VTQRKPREIYAWIHKNSGNFSIALCCLALHVRREGYYHWLRRKSPAQRDSELVSALKEVRKMHPCYGVRSMLDELPQAQKVSYGKGYRVCRDNGLLTKRRKPKSLTKADPAAQAADDLVKRDFTAAAPNEKWLTDITEMQCKDGKLYLCAVLDCFDGSIVGHSMDTNMKTPLCTAALTGAVKRYGSHRDWILHSDRGSQHTSHLFRKILEANGFRQSMGRTGSCYDNARMESFFATFKKELIYRLPLYRLTRQQVKGYAFEWIETYYNRKRRHTANAGNMPPLMKRAQWYAAQKAA